MQFPQYDVDGVYAPRVGDHVWYFSIKSNCPVRTRIAKIGTTITFYNNKTIINSKKEIIQLKLRPTAEIIPVLRKRFNEWRNATTTV